MFKSVRRNSPIKQYNYVGLWTMRVDACRVLDWSDPDFRMRADIPDEAGGGSVFQASFSDASGASIDMEVPMQREFADVRPGDEAVGVVVSDVATLERFKCLRDVFLPDVGCWVSEYPFVERSAFLRVLNSLR